MLCNTIIDNGAWVRWPAQNEGYQLTVISATGSMVRSTRSEGADHWLNTENLSAGLYVLRLSVAKVGTVRSLKFIKE